MKRKVTVEQRRCDFCNSNYIVYNLCLGCGKDICYECRKHKAVDYHRGVSVSGSGNGTYCLPCDAIAEKNGNELHKAYVAIRDLRVELSEWSNGFNARQKRAEEHLQSLLCKVKK